MSDTTTETTAGTTAGQPAATFRAFTPPDAAGHVWNVGFTLSAPAAGTLVTRVTTMLEALAAHGWTPAYGFAGPGRAEMHAAGRSEAPPVTPVSPPAGTTVLATGAATGPDGPTEGVIASDYYIISAEPGGKSRVKFWRHGRKFAEIDTVRQTENLPSLLGGMPVGLGQHDIATVVAWQRGNPKPSGKGHYQDIVSVTAAVPS